MLTTTKQIGLGAALLPLTFMAFSAVPALAQRPAAMVHRAIRAKVLREAHDRKHVEFRTTHSVKLSSRLRRVTGRGIFQRGRRKPPQMFAYHGNVDVYSGTISNLGYNINK